MVAGEEAPETSTAGLQEDSLTEALNYSTIFRALLLTRSERLYYSLKTLKTVTKDSTTQDSKPRGQNGPSPHLTITAVNAVGQCKLHHLRRTPSQ